MTAAIAEARPLRAAGIGALEGSALRSERSMALIRIGIVGAVTWIYLSSLGIRRSLGPAAIVILALAGLYGVVTLLALVGDEVPSWRARVVTLLMDVLLITLWVQATGGPRSEFWTLYLIAVVSTALRFRLVDTLGVAVGLTVLHLALSVADGGLSRPQMIYRPALMIATGFAVGVLAYQRAANRTERNELEALAQTRGVEVERLRRVDMKRSEFVAIAAHELRTPLAAVMGVLGTLKAHGTALDEDVRVELIEGAQAQAERLARLVDDLLTASRIEDGAVRLHPGRAEPELLVAEAERASGTVGRVHVETGDAGAIACDADAIVRVLTNLLDNARKYSPEGTPIAVAVSQDDDRVRFAVRDAGAGVRLEDRERVFERFRRLGDGLGPGAGLGLYISRGLVEAHGGEVSVGDAPEGGAEFSFTLPRRRADVDLRDDDVTQITAGATGAR